MPQEPVVQLLKEWMEEPSIQSFKKLMSRIWHNVKSWLDWLIELLKEESRQRLDSVSPTPIFSEISAAELEQALAGVKDATKASLAGVAPQSIDATQNAAERQVTKPTPTSVQRPGRTCKRSDRQLTKFNKTQEYGFG